MKTFIVNYWREIRYFFGLKGNWIGSIAYILVSLITAMGMGAVYIFNNQAQKMVGLENVGVYLLTGFFMQYLVFSSLSKTPAKIYASFSWDMFEYLIFYNVSITQYVTGVYIALFSIDIFLSIPFIITTGIVVSNAISISSFFAFLGFVILSGFCLTSFAIFFSGLMALSKNFRGFRAVIAYIIQFICGLYFPIHAYLSLFGNLGGWMAIVIVSLFPYTYLFDIARYIVFSGTYTPIYPLWLNITLFILSSLVFYGIGILIFKLAVTKWRKKGFRSYIY